MKLTDYTQLLNNESLMSVFYGFGDITTATTEQELEDLIYDIIENHSPLLKKDTWNKIANQAMEKHGIMNPDKSSDETDVDNIFPLNDDDYKMKLTKAIRIEIHEKARDYIGHSRDVEKELDEMGEELGEYFVDEHSIQYDGPAQTKGIKTAYIISWLGSDDEEKEKRKQEHFKQIVWIKKQGLKIVVLPQLYEKEDYIDGIEYLENQTALLSPASARNILLKKFYNSDDEVAVFADNDGAIDSIGCGKTFIQDFNNNWKHYDMIDICFPTFAVESMGFAKTDIKRNLEWNKAHHTFKRRADSKGTFFIVRNFRKFYDEEIYFDSWFDDSKFNPGNLVPSEDIDFILQAVKKGWGTFQIKNVILKEFGGENDSLWQRGLDKRIDRNAEAVFYIHDKYGIPIIDKNNDGSELTHIKPDCKWMIKKYPHSSGKLPLTFPINMKENSFF